MKVQGIVCQAESWLSGRDGGNEAELCVHECQEGRVS